MCIFCKIVNGEIPSYKVYEDPLFIAILDINQATKGHTLLIPKKHFPDLFALEEKEQKQLGLAITSLSKQIKQAFDIENMNILNNNGVLAGQTVQHFHVHLIPRYTHNDVEITFKHNNLTKDEFCLLQEKILAKR